MFVKICGITSEEDALLSVAVGADALGFVFAPSPRQVSAVRVADIVKRLPPEVLTVGVFRNEAAERVTQIVHQAGLQGVQLHGSETPEVVQRVKEDVRVVFKAVVAGTPTFEQAGAFGADAILVDASSPGSGQVFDWRLAEDAPPDVSIIMAGGLTVANVAEAIEKVRPWGVDVSTGVERRPGVKDPILVRNFVGIAKATGPMEFESTAALGDEPYNWQEDATWR